MVGKALKPSDHQKPDVRKVLEQLVSEGWTLSATKHWGTLLCPCPTRCSSIPVDHTPKSPTAHAKRIANTARRCPKDPDDPRRSLRSMERDR
jgi:hypothetical protein